MKILRILTPEKQALFWQIVRYGLTGLFVTACQAVIYWTLAAPVGVHPQIANGVGYLAAVAIGYVTHSSFTFRPRRPLLRGLAGQLRAQCALGVAVRHPYAMAGMVTHPGHAVRDPGRDVRAQSTMGV